MTSRCDVASSTEWLKVTNWGKAHSCNMAECVPTRRTTAGEGEEGADPCQPNANKRRLRSFAVS